MLRTSGKAAGLAGRGVAAGAAVTIASVLLLTGCGGNDSTASSTPTLKTSTTTAAPTTTTSAPATAPSTTAAAAKTTTSEQPQPAVTPTLAPPKITAKDQAFLDALKARGVSVSSADIPLAVANYICQAKKSNVSQQEVQTYVNAMAGQDPSYDPNKMPIAQLGQIYVDVANQTYCNK